MLTAWRISPGGQEIDQQFDGFDGDLRLGLFGAGSQVGCAEGAWAFRTAGCFVTGLFLEYVQGDAGDASRSSGRRPAPASL